MLESSHIAEEVMFRRCVEASSLFDMVSMEKGILKRETSWGYHTAWCAMNKV